MHSEPRRRLMTVAWTVLIVCGLAAGFAMHRLWELRRELEQLAARLTLDVGPESTLIYDDDNNLVSALFEEHRIAVRIEEMSPLLLEAVLVTEDRRFYDHYGVDIRRIVAAFLANQRAGGIVEGGSTITQQLVRSILLDQERTYSRKFKEAILARRLEERYSKRAILEAYLNRVYFGDGYYGVEAAAMGYFGKKASGLDAAESAILAGLIKGPSIYTPTRHADACRERRDLVLDEMRQAGLLGERDYQAAIATSVKALLIPEEKRAAADPRRTFGAEYFRDAVSRELIEKFGAETVSTGGLRVYTTLDRELQQLAEATITSRLRGYDEGMQGALVAIDPRTGFVKAIVGGRGFREAPFNRAIDARRQPGSTFKPFVFAAALEAGMSPGSVIFGLDEPIQTREGPWLPGGEHESSSTNLRTALALSSNRAAAHLMQDIGINRTLDLVQRAGITSPLPAVPSLALGSGEVSLFELTSAYGVFANRGVWRQPTMIRRVIDRDGREIYRTPEMQRPVVSEATAYMMASMMSDVLTYGTAATARAQGVKFQAAGKTGTSQDYSDAWFVGFTPSMVAGVWFGYDKPRPIAQRGFASVVAVPAWARFMTGAMRGTTHDWIDMPGGLVKVKICRLSGALATDKCQEPVYQPAPYDPNDAATLGATGTMREGGVYEDVMPAHRVPPPCTMFHGAPPPDLTDAASASRDELDLTDPVRALEPHVPDQTVPVTPPPAFMTERPSRVITLPPTTQSPAQSLRPAMPSTTTSVLPATPANADAPIIPGAPSQPPAAPRRPPG
jgi:1A family penicillin-binding protein